MDFLSLFVRLLIQAMNSVFCDHCCHELAREIDVGMRKEIIFRDKLIHFIEFENFFAFLFFWTLLTVFVRLVVGSANVFDRLT